MDISALLNSTDSFSGETSKIFEQLPPYTKEASPQSSQDAYEVFTPLSRDTELPMELESSMIEPSEYGQSTPAESPQPSEITGGTSDRADREEVIDDDDEDMVSELSQGQDLQDDLQEALDEQKFSFTGTFYHASLLATAPNPCLHISGLGAVGLPLSDRDAKSIIFCANLAPFGHGERTLIDKTVRDTWEVEPGRVTFLNTHWEPYLKSTVIHEVCKSLGVTIGNHPPKMELHKLLLYEKGSHFLPHQDTQKADGMFATIIVILPSHYAGGQVVVSHASTTETIDFAPNSLLSTAVLAWYTDVKHEVKEVTTGYRLALSYNLIHCTPSSSIPRAGFPEFDDAVIPLRRALTKWKAGKYNDDLDRNLIAYLLEHEYSGVDLNAGLKALKGVDAHRVNFLRPVAEELGIKVGLASLDQHVKGDADDCGAGYYRRGRYDDYSSEDSGLPEMIEITDTTTTISDLVDMDGNALISKKEICLGQEELIPRAPFEGEEPDDTEYEGYTGNEAGQLEYWYHRTVLVLIPIHKIDDILYSVEGISYAFRKLKESTAILPTAGDHRWANRLISKDGHRLTKENVATLVDYALKWQDLRIWKNLTKLRTCTLQAVDIDRLLGAWELFSFEAVRVSFEELLARSTQLSERMKFIFDVRSKASAKDEHDVLPWCQKESDKMLTSHTIATVGDVPTLTTIIRIAGLQSFKRIIMPNLLSKDDNFDFWIAFVKALREGKETILEPGAESAQPPELTLAVTAVADAAADPATDRHASTSAEPPHIEEADVLIKESLQAAALRWSNIPPPPPPAYHYYGRSLQSVNKISKVDRIIQVVEEAVTIPDLEICRNLFLDIIKIEGQMVNNFDEVYVPLVPRLRSLFLTNKHLEISTPPFVDLFQVLIGRYLKDVLVDKAHRSVHLRKLGCGCQDCNRLDTFILDPKSSTTTFWIAQARRTHLEDRLMKASDLCKFTTIQRGSPHGLEVTKLPKVVQASTWEGRLKAAKAFLKSIGPDAVIAQIMGPRYLEVLRALEGVTPFGSAKNNMAAPSAARTSRGHQLPSASSSSAPSTISKASTTASAAQPIPAQIAGKKRKNMVQLGPVIDLTEDD